jgi:hypothetical protein
VDGPLALEDGLLYTFYALVVFVCAPYKSFHRCFCERFSFAVFCLPIFLKLVDNACKKKIARVSSNIAKEEAV